MLLFLLFMRKLVLIKVKQFAHKLVTHQHDYCSNEALLFFETHILFIMLQCLSESKNIK